MTSSMRSLERGSPDATIPAYRIQGLVRSAGTIVRSERRSNSAREMPSRLASRLAAAYSDSARLICVRIMITSSHITLSHARQAHDQTTMADSRRLAHLERIPIRWGDMEAMGHVNNTVYSRYMEEARISWVKPLIRQEA